MVTTELLCHFEERGTSEAIRVHKIIKITDVY